MGDILGGVTKLVVVIAAFALFVGVLVLVVVPLLGFLLVVVGVVTAAFAILALIEWAKPGTLNKHNLKNSRRRRGTIGNQGGRNG